MISLRSKITTTLLNFFFLHSSEQFYINDLARRLSLDPANTDKMLKKLEQEGILASERVGVERFYSLNFKYPLLEEYRQIVMKTIGLEGKIRQALNSLAGLKQAYIFGSYAKGNDDKNSDIDVLLIGAHSSVEALKKLLPIQKEVGREINVVNMTEGELLRKKKAKDPFVANIFSGKIIKL